MMDSISTIAGFILRYFKPNTLFLCIVKMLLEGFSLLSLWFTLPASTQNLKCHSVSELHEHWSQLL